MLVGCDCDSQVLYSGLSKLIVTMRSTLFLSAYMRRCPEGKRGAMLVGCECDTQVLYSVLSKVIVTPCLPPDVSLCPDPLQKTKQNLNRPISHGQVWHPSVRLTTSQLISIASLSISVTSKPIPDHPYGIPDHPYFLRLLRRRNNLVSDLLSMLLRLPGWEGPGKSQSLC